MGTSCGCPKTSSTPLVALAIDLPSYFTSSVSSCFFEEGF